LAVSFQVVELELDDQGNVLDRKVVPYPYQSLQDAAACAKSVAARYPEARYNPANNDWCAIGSRGVPVRVVIEEIEG
jgi:hypothetical protein